MTTSTRLAWRDRLDTLRSVTRWTMQHGMVGLATRHAARNGDLHARILVEPGLRDSPWAVHTQVRGGGPLVSTRLAYATASHAGAREVLRSDAFGVGMNLQALPAPVRRLATWSRNPRSRTVMDPPSLLAIDPPDHTRLRRLVTGFFTPRAVRALRERVEREADRLLEELAGSETVDLVAAYARVLPATVIGEILGLPPQERAVIIRLGEAAVPSMELGLGWRDFRSAESAMAELNGWVSGHLQRLRASPGDDLLSRLVVGGVDGDRVEESEVHAIAALLVLAGFETTASLLASGTRQLLQAPGQLRVLRENPSLWPNAVEELQRLEPPVHDTGRLALRETRVCGVPVPAGARINVLIGGANRDPEVFPDPDRLDVRRANAREHLSFSAGRHFCAGAALARIEGEIGLRRLFERYPDLSLAGGERRRPRRVMRGWDRLPVRLQPKPGVAPPQC